MSIETSGIINNYTVAITSVIFILLLVRVINFRERTIFTFLTGFLIFLYIFIGWEYISYDEKPDNYGEKVYLSGPLYIVNNTKKVFSSDAVRRNYDNIVIEITQPAHRDYYEDHYSDSTIEMIDLKKVYTVVSTFKVIAIGFLQFGSPETKYRVIKDENGLEYVQYR